jgi:hypothetical protein
MILVILHIPNLKFPRICTAVYLLQASNFFLYMALRDC